MKREKVLQREDALKNEKALVDELAKYVEDEEFVYVEMQQVEDGKPVFTDKKLPKRAECSFRYLDVCKEIRKMTKEKIPFISFDSIVHAPVEIAGEGVINMTLLSWKTPRDTHFLGDAMTHNQRIDDGKDVHSVVVSGYIHKLGKVVELIFPFKDTKDCNTFVEDIRDMLGRKLFVSGMLIPQFLQTKRASGMLVEQRYKVFVNSWFIAQDDFLDVCEIVPKINTYKDLSPFRDYATGEPIYDEEVNVLMWFNAFYTRMGDPVFNLVLSGPPSIAKTFCLQLYQAIFGDKGSAIVQSSSSTVKGLLPSYKNGVKNGAFIEARFFIGVDELFRSPASEAHSQGWKSVTQQVQSYLSKLLPVVSRKRQQQVSGTGDFSEPMKASLMATDNLTVDTMNALKEIVPNDPAVLRRFTFISIGTDTEWQRLESASIKPSEEELVPLCDDHWRREYGYGLKKMKRLGEWARSRVGDVVVDGPKCIKIISKELLEILKEVYAGEGALWDEEKMKKIQQKVVFRLHMEAAVRCVVITRCLFEQKEKQLPEEFIAKEEDYVEAIRILRRPLKTSIFMFKEALDELVSPSSIERH